jgi:hypothetical protein
LVFFILTLAFTIGCVETPQEVDVVATPTPLPEITQTPTALAKVEIELIEFPSEVKEGDTIRIRWHVVGEEITASHSAIHYDGLSRQSMPWAIIRCPWNLQLF